MLVALALATTPVALPAEVEKEIVVLGFKFRKMKFKADVRQENGVTLVRKCRITRSSKDKEIDALGCGVARQCAATNPETVDEFTLCMKTRGDAAIAELAARRVAAKTAS